MGASGWDYYVPYDPDVSAALTALRAEVLRTGDYWWAVPGELGKSASQFPNRPTTEEELWADDVVRMSGTHSVLDIDRLAGPGDYSEIGLISPVTDADARELVGTTVLTRAHVGKLERLPGERWTGRYAVLHDNDGNPAELYFWGYSGD